LIYEKKRLSKSVFTVKRQLYSMFRKLAVSSRTQLASLLLTQLIPPRQLVDRLCDRKCAVSERITVKTQKVALRKAGCPVDSFEISETKEQSIGHSYQKA